jgi:hypothetical protein
LLVADGLATLLWRRALDRSGEPESRPPSGGSPDWACLLAAVLALWLSLAVGRGWLV